MQMQHIEKAIYRKHLNMLIVAIIVSLMVLALGASTLFIELIGEPGGSNFFLNLTGVVVAAATVGFLLYHYRHTPFMHEITYVWHLKQELNRIYRKLAAVNAAAAANNINALIIMNFNLKGSVQLYELDDNDLTLSELKGEVQEFDTKIKALGLDISTKDYHSGLLAQLNQ